MQEEKTFQLGGNESLEHFECLELEMSEYMLPFEASASSGLFGKDTKSEISHLDRVEETVTKVLSCLDMNDSKIGRQLIRCDCHKAGRPLI